MSPLLVQFLRRLTVVALLVAVLLLVLPRVLTELGVLGPSAEERVASAARAVEAARRYGADEHLPAYVAARTTLQEAQAHIQAGRFREARRLADQAAEKAILAQRDGLVRREAERRRAEAIVTEADRRLIELEALYGRASKVVGKARVGELLALMKTGRQAGSGLVLLYEQDEFARVIAGEKEALVTLDSVREALRQAQIP